MTAADSHEELVQIAKGAASAVWARLKGEAPSYPALEVWLALAGQLRAEGTTELLDAQGHKIFVNAYEAELRALTRAVEDLNAQLAELGKEAAVEAWVEGAGQLNRVGLGVYGSLGPPQDDNARKSSGPASRRNCLNRSCFTLRPPHVEGARADTFDAIGPFREPRCQPANSVRRCRQ